MNNLSLDDSIGYDKDGNEITLGEVLKDEYIDTGDIIDLKDNVELLRKYMGVLTKREKKLLLEGMVYLIKR